ADGCNPPTPNVGKGGKGGAGGGGGGKNGENGVGAKDPNGATISGGPGGAGVVFLGSASGSGFDNGIIQALGGVGATAIGGGGVLVLHGTSLSFGPNALFNGYTPLTGPRNGTYQVNDLASTDYLAMAGGAGGGAGGDGTLFMTAEPCTFLLCTLGIIL